MAKNTRNAYGFGQGSPLPSMSPLPILALRNPLTSDLNFEIGTNWINTTNNRIWILASTAANAATWTDVSGTVLPEIELLTPDSGGAVGPDAVNHNITIVGGTGVDTVGTPGTNTITINASAGEASISQYIVAADGSADYTTIQAALTAANTAAIPATVVVRPGTYTENLTLFDNISIFGTDALETTITGVHTPPASGNVTISNCLLTNATDIFNSAVAGTTTLFINSCEIRAVNGFLFNLLNWTGDLIVDNCGSTGTNDGFVNNTGGSIIVITASTVGAGTGNPFVASNGTVLWEVARVQCPGTIGGTATAIISMGSRLEGTLTTAATATVTISNTSFVTGATAAISHGSANVLTLSQVTINSANATPIGGAGAGALDLGNIDFVQNSGIAGTITQTYSRATDRTTPYIVGLTGNFATIQAALDAATTTGLGETVIVQPGTYTEDLTLYTLVDIRGLEVSGTTITGTHIPPAAGRCAFYNCTLTDALDIFNSAAAGTTDIIIDGCIINATNGYLFNLLNWTGDLIVDNCGSTGTNDGFVNNTGGSAIFVTTSTVGAGVGNAFVASNGTFTLQATAINCPGTIGGTATSDIRMGSVILGTITTAATATVSIANSLFSTGATAAISQGSANDLTLSNITINTSNNPAIDGAGAGDVYLSGVEFLDGSNLAATLTINSSPETRTTKVLAGDSTYRVNAFNLDSNIIQAYSDDVTPTGASTLSSIQGNQSVTAGDGNHTPNAVFGSLTAASGSNMLQGLGVYGLVNQADGSIIASTFAGVEGQCDIDETDAADLPQIFAFGTKGFLTGEDAGGIPTTGEFAGVGSVVGYNTPFNGYAYGVCSTRLGGGAGTAGRAAFGVAQGTQAIADWLYGLDLFNTTPGNGGQAYTTADIRMQNQSTIAVQATGVTFSGDVNARALNSTNTDITFNGNPNLQSILSTGAAPSGATGATNIMTCQDGLVKEQFIIGAGQTIIAPRMENDGLLISLDLISTEGAEYNYGVPTSSKHQFLAGTSAAFFYEVSFKVADVSGCEPLFMGFRSVEATSANYVVYNDLAGLGIVTSQNADLITQGTTVGGGGATFTNTQDAWTDGQTHTLRVNVAADGAVTYLIDGVAPTAFTPYTFAAVSVMPYISFAHAAVAPGAIHQLTEKCGFQDWN